MQESCRVEAMTRDLFLHARDERNQDVRQELEARERLIEQAQAERQARIAAEAERRRLALEEEQRAREEARRQQLAAEEEQRRREREEAEEARRQLLAAEEEQRRREREEAEQRRRERERECAVCLEENDMGDMMQVPCTHWYCRQHLRGKLHRSIDAIITGPCRTDAVLDALEAAYNTRRPFRCCHEIVPIDNLGDLLTADFSNSYRDLLEESSATNPIYCSNRNCSNFIPAAHAQGPDLMNCRRCGSGTCRHCRDRAHEGRECIADVGTQQARALAEAHGWQACPNCAHMVEKSQGCLHMTCRCGTQFCYACGSLYRQCPRTCRAG